MTLPPVEPGCHRIRLAIIGAGELGRQVAHHAQAIPGYVVIGFFDDTCMVGNLLHGLPLLGATTAVLERYGAGEFDQLVIAIGYRHMDARHAMYERFKGKLPFGALIHPSATIDRDAKIGDGAIIYPGCVVDTGAKIGANTLLNIGCIVAHDTSVGDSCFIAPGVNIAGFVSIGRSVQLGIGTVVIDNVLIAPGVTTGAGAVVTRDLNEAGVYIGIPARMHRTREGKKS